MPDTLIWCGRLGRTFWRQAPSDQNGKASVMLLSSSTPTNLTVTLILTAVTAGRKREASKRGNPTKPPGGFHPYEPSHKAKHLGGTLTVIPGKKNIQVFWTNCEFMGYAPNRNTAKVLSRGHKQTQILASLVSTCGMPMNSKKVIFIKNKNSILWNPFY